MPKQSAGILLHRMRHGAVEVLLVHPGGPFWARRDAGAWSIPKGEYTGGETPLDAAVREFREETGAEVDPALAVPLGSVTQRGGKVVTAWAIPGDFDVASLVGNLVEVEWPRGSGALRSFPEVDRAEWFEPDEARRKINAAQAEFVDRLVESLQTGT